MTVVAVLLPRFALVVAAGGRAALLAEPAALAPEPGREQLVGEVSPAAEAFGVRPGMRMGEALARCPRLALVPPDPVGTADAWERVLERLESIGAAVESDRPGVACFAAGGLRRLHGGHLDGTLDAARRALGAGPARLGAGPPRAARAHDPRAGRGRPARGGRHVARARRLPRGARRRRAHAPRAGTAHPRAARARRDAAAVGRALRPAGRRPARAAGRLGAPAPRPAARGRPAGARGRRARRRAARPGR